MVPNQAALPSSPRWSLQANPLRTDIRLLFQAAMLVFVITVAIGILNGLHLVGQLSQDVLLTHVHAGTLGWITLSVFAVSLWFFGEGKAPTETNRYVRTMSILAAVCIPLYVLAFLSGNFIARAVFGFPVLLLMIGFFGWIVARSLQIRLTVARLALLGALFTLIVGSVIGVLLQIQFATNNAFLPSGAFAAHPATQVVGYLLLVGMAISEWRFKPDTGKLPRAGVIQIAFPFIAGLVLTIGTLLNNNALLGVNVLFELIGILIYIVRFTPPVLRVSWVARTSDRFFAFSAVNVAILTYLIITTLTGFYASFEVVPPWLFFALDHAMFIGVMSNALFGLILIVTEERRAFWPWADDVLFWGMNFGMVGFVISLLLDARILERIFTPIMGLSILLALLTYTIRMRRSSEPGAVEVRVGA